MGIALIIRRYTNVLFTLLTTFLVLRNSADGQKYAK